jgi:ABC-type multidrug transport system ATPase subunit
MAYGFGYKPFTSLTMLSIKGLSLQHKQQLRLDNINLTIREGDVLCLAGRNGAGKTSLLRCLAGLEKKYTGTIEFSKVFKDLRRYLGVMIDGPSLYTHLSGYTNLDIIRRYHGLPQNAITDTLHLVGLINDGDKKVKHYSSGMRQRLGIAMAFIHKPPIVILDEPLNALDPEAIVDIRKIINYLNTEYKTTFIITSHSLEEIRKIFTHLAILKNGKLAVELTQADAAHYVVAGNDLLSTNDAGIAEFLRDKQILASTKESTIEFLGKREWMDELKNKYQGSSNWTDFRPASLEDIYLFVNT